MKLTSASLEALSEVNLVLVAASFLVPGAGQAAVAAASAAVSALKTAAAVQISGGKWAPSDIVSVAVDAAMAVAGGIALAASPALTTVVEIQKGIKLTAAQQAIVGTQEAWSKVQEALSSIKTAGISIAKAKELSKQIRRGADAARQQAQLELDKIAAEDAAFRAEIAKIKAQIDEIRRRKAAVAVAKKKTPVAASPITRTAEKLGVSEVTVIAGGLAAIAGVVVVVSLLQED